MTTPAAVFPPTYAPVGTLMMYLTEECNLRCDYCFVEKKARRMTEETARRTVEWFLSPAISGALYDVSITCFGGEPFTEPELMAAIVASAREYRPNTHKRVGFSATTNGTVATPRVERLIRDARMALLVSLDGGPAAGAHRPFVSGRSSYDVVARNLPRLVSWAADVVVRMTFHPQALDLVGNVRHVLDLGAPAVALCPVLEADWRGHEAALEAAYQALADWYLEEARAGRIPPLEMTHLMLRQWHAHRHGAPRPGRPCQVGTGLLGVNVDGKVMPCHRFLDRPQDWLGTVRDAALPADRLKYVHLSSRNFLGCDSCAAEPVCGGGCRAVAVHAGYGLEEAHPAYCLTTRAHARAARRIYDTLVSENNAAFLRILLGRRPLSGALAELAAR